MSDLLTLSRRHSHTWNRLAEQQVWQWHHEGFSQRCSLSLSHSRISPDTASSPSSADTLVWC